MHIVFVIAPGGGPDAFVKTIRPLLEKSHHCVSVIYTAAESSVRAEFPSSVIVKFAPTGNKHYYLARVVGNRRGWARQLRARESAQAVYHALSAIERECPVDLVEVVEGLPLDLIGERWRTVVRAQGADWTVRQFCQDEDTRFDDALIAMEAQQLKKANAVMALSQHLAQHVSAACRFPQESITVIPYPIDTEQFSPSGESRSGNQTPVVLSVGRLEKRKGMDVLVRAMGRVWENVPDAQLVLVGAEGDFRQQELRAQVLAERQTQLVMPGFVDRATTADYFRRAAVYVTATQYETFGYTVLEAMASGAPVVASRVGGIPELVEDGVTGMLVEAGDAGLLGDAITRVLTDAEMRAEMGGKAREKAVREYRVEAVLEQTMAVYEGVMRS